MKILRALAVIFLMLGTILGTFTACQSDYLPEYESGFYKYAVQTGKDGIKKAYLTGLTDLGLKQKVLILPNLIEGVDVVSIGYRKSILVGHETVGDFHSTNLEKLFIPKGLGEYLCCNLPNCQIVKWDEEDNVTFSGVNNAIFGYNFIEKNLWIKDYGNKKVANVSYMYNYSKNLNSGYYWVDSYDATTISFIPPEPIREGYLFDGWYKEPECINKWDFEKDKTGKELVISDVQKYEKYEGIYLYAKWIDA